MKKYLKVFLLLSLISLFSLPVLAQKSKPGVKKNTPLPEMPGMQKHEPVAISQTGDPALDLAIQELYAVISGPAGQKRDWEKFRAMFAANARMGFAFTDKSGNKGFRGFTPEEYINTSGPYLEEKGFFETELSRKIERYGQIVHVWSTYEARNTQEETKPVMRGINSIQLVKISEQYKITSLIWQQESAEYPLPAAYLPAGRK